MAALRAKSATVVAMEVGRVFQMLARPVEIHGHCNNDIETKHDY
jgi:hypothetical protein